MLFPLISLLRRGDIFCCSDYYPLHLVNKVLMTWDADELHLSICADYLLIKGPMASSFSERSLISRFASSIAE